MRVTACVHDVQLEVPVRLLVNPLHVKVRSEMQSLKLNSDSTHNFLLNYINYGVFVLHNCFNNQVSMDYNLSFQFPNKKETKSDEEQ
jgi:hypothetical protein